MFYHLPANVFILFYFKFIINAMYLIKKIEKQKN